MYLRPVLYSSSEDEHKFRASAISVFLIIRKLPNKDNISFNDLSSNKIQNPKLNDDYIAYTTHHPQAGIIGGT
jgi:hypothetical protein